MGFTIFVVFFSLGKYGSNSGDFTQKTKKKGDLLWFTIQNDGEVQPPWRNTRQSNGNMVKKWRTSWRKWWKNGEPGNGDGLWFIYGQTIGRVLTGCYKLYLLAVMLLSNQTSQTWQWKIPAFTDDFPNSTYTFRRFSIAMFVDHKVLLFFCFVFFGVCVCVCVILGLGGQSEGQENLPKKRVLEATPWRRFARPTAAPFGIGTTETWKKRCGYGQSPRKYGCMGEQPIL